MEEYHEEEKLIYKIIIVGEMGTGKTSLIRKFVDDNFSEFYKVTIGVDFANKIIKNKNNINIDIQLWDIAGQERFSNMTGVYYRESIAAIIVFDILRNNTFELCKFWKEDIDSKIFTSEGNPIPTLLFANKIDLKPNNWDINQNKIIEKFVNENNFLKYFETSAKNGTNLNEAFDFLINYIYNNKIEPEFSKSTTLKIKENDINKNCC